MSNNFVASAKDLCRIIKVSSQCQVREIVIGKLQIKFGSLDQGDPKNILVETKPVDEQSTKISEEALEKEHVERLQDDLEELKITDPLAYERLLGENLEDGGSS